ncbi:hypothetical protein B5M09_012680 [Aphanomyces astaci]|uniref:C2 domain-containing protein n=1 Tax=Aphanomyces astaci TaxID=112090 RepID=A0A3R7WB31_APHAT|nr:hypothetical protein B5M09_012680 [Aphanomyces astaci]
MQSGHRGLTRSQLKTVALRHATLGGGFSNGHSSVVSMNPSADIALPDLFFRLMCHDCELYKSEVATKTLNPVWATVDLHSDDPSQQHASRYLAEDDMGFDVVVYRLINAASSSHSSFFHPLVGANDHITVDEGIDEEDEEDEYEDTYDLDLVHPQHPVSYVSLPHNDDDSGADDDEESFFEEEVFRFHIDLDELEPLQCDFRELFYLPLNTLVLEFASTYYVRRDVMSMLVQNDVIKARRVPRGDFPALLSTQPLQSEFHMATAADLVDSTINLHRQIRLARADVEKHMLSADQRLPRTLAQLSHLDAKQAEMNTGILYRRYIIRIGAMFSLQMALVSMDVLRVAHSIRALQATLVVQLYDIYPIAYLGAGEYSIGGIKFSNADATNGKDEELLSTALGYIAHFVFLVAKYLNVNLRYAIVHLSSRSYMRDDVNDPHGEYPLYKRGVDKDRFDKAFLFLRKDVEQMLLARGLELGQNTQLLMRLTTLVESELEWVKHNA